MQGWNPRIWKSIFIAVALSMLQTPVLHASKHLQSCHIAQLQCHARSGCQMALNNFFLHCHAIIKGEEVGSCPTDCKDALVSLLSTADDAGLAFINCDCHKGEVCAQRKERVEICQREVLESMNILREDSLPVSCNLARGICEADTSCLAALQYYYDHCSRLLSGLRCTSKCRNSLEILSRQSHASKLKNCNCDGSEDYNCRALKVNTETMCLHNKLRPKSETNYVLESSGEMSKDSDEHLTSKQIKAREKKKARRRKRRNRALSNLKKARREKRRQNKLANPQGKKISGIVSTVS
ncbi:unnamed protein product [Lymnaea stagnalis]|uniref:GDNF/GAS1 domain-containing protein n=1 Tax=Lymnaea stagnalis TaxID=6523 RepID=A0AAV2GXK7_LYMST